MVSDTVRSYDRSLFPQHPLGHYSDRCRSAFAGHNKRHSGSLRFEVEYGQLDAHGGSHGDCRRYDGPRDCSVLRIEEHGTIPAGGHCSNLSDCKRSRFLGLHDGRGWFFSSDYFRRWADSRFRHHDGDWCGDGIAQRFHDRARNGFTRFG